MTWSSLGGGRVVVVGGGIAGVSTAAALRAGGFLGEVVLIDRSTYPYDRPPLSKDYLAGTRGLTQILLQDPDWYAEHKVDLIGDVTVMSIDPEAGRVTLDDSRVICGDWIVLATGGRAARPPIPGSDSRRVHVLREHTDADRLREALVPGARLLVVGAGLIGAEAAATASELGCSVTIVDPMEVPLAAAVGMDTAAWLHGLHGTHGVETLTTTVESFRETATGISAQLHGEVRSREFDAVLLGVGMIPETSLAQQAGLDVDGGILVDESLITSHPRVLAIGDSARHRDRRRTEHWEAAQVDGQRAAATILGSPAPIPKTHWFWSDRYHHHVEGVGEMRDAAAEHLVVVRGEVGVPPFSVWTLRLMSDDSASTVVSVCAVDDSNAIRAARRMIERRTAVDHARITDPSTDLRKLLRS